MLQVAIVGGGLSGLALAERLQKAQLRFAVFEARNRFGGRILSYTPDSQTGEPAPFRNDLGPSWVWPDAQHRIAEFINRHGLSTMAQWQQGLSLYLPDRKANPQAFKDSTTYASARRIVGGSYRLIESLLCRLPPNSLHLNHRLTSLLDRGDHVELNFELSGRTIIVRARQVVLAIPPRLIGTGIDFQPPLAGPMRNAMQATPTWMAGQAKALIYYAEPFWRAAGYSGSAFTPYQGAALMEIFDAGSESGHIAALSGFFALPAALRREYREDLEALITEQLVRLFGAAAAKPLQILLQDWYCEPYTANLDDETPLIDHPRYGHPWLQLDHWNDKLYFGASETAAEYGGYLEGALAAAQRIGDALELTALSLAG